MGLGMLLASSALSAAASSALASDTASAQGTQASLCGLGIDVTFREGAPRDRFSFVNTSSQGWHIDRISLQLENTAGNLIFDTQAGGDGVEVYQLFEVENSTATLVQTASPDDGANRLDLTFSRFEAGDSFTFSIDVDDQLVSSELGQIRVSDSEMAGGVVAVTLRDAAGELHALEMVFDDQSRSTIALPAC